MLAVVTTSKTVTEVAQAFPEVCAQHKFGILGTIDLRQKLTEKGFPFDRECVIFEVCNPKLAKMVLDRNIAISAALPCRISVYREGGETNIAAIKPTALLALFRDPELMPMAREVEWTIIQIMESLA